MADPVSFATRSPGRPPAGEFIVPQTWFEWIHMIYDPRRFILQRQHYGKRIKADGAADNTDNITVPEPFFCFAVRSRARVSSGANSGLYPTQGYRLGVLQANGQDWFNKEWDAAIITGDVSLEFMMHFPDWQWPRPLMETEQVTMTVDNSDNVAGDPIRVDVNLVGYVIRTFVMPEENQ